MVTSLVFAFCCNHNHKSHFVSFTFNNRTETNICTLCRRVNFLFGTNCNRFSHEYKLREMIYQQSQHFYQYIKISAK